jgi:hypothetical protein
MSVQKLTCKACGYSNEIERVYCHNCGAKLDRAALPKADPKHDLREAQRVRKIVKPKDPVIRRFIRGFVESVIMAALTAFVVLAFCPPPKLPAIPTDEERLTAPQLNLVLERSSQTTTPQSIVLNEPVVNAYIASRVRSKPTELFAGLTATNESVLVAFKDKLVNITVSNKISVVTLHFTTRYDLALKDGKLIASLKGGSIGRAPLHPLLMNSFEQLVFPSVWKALESEYKVLGAMRSITVDDGKITIISEPGRLAR